MNKKKILSIIFMAILILFLLCIIYKLSSMNTNSSNGKSTDIITIFIEDTLSITNKYGITNSHPNEEKLEHASELLNAPLRKVMHASVYFALSFFIIILVNYLFKNNKYLLSSLLTIVLIVILSSLDEYHQTFVFGRTGQLKDVLIDSAGGLCGIMFYGTYYYVYKLGYKRGINNEKK